VRSPFVGRARELALLHDRLAAAGAGQGQVVGLVGEPGMGKSRLLVEFCRSVPAHQVTAYVGQCLSYGSATPYLPVCDLLRASCGITPADSVDTLIEKVRGGLQAVGMAPDAGAPYVLSLLGVEAGTAQLTGMSPEALKATTFETLRQLLLRRSQQHPLLLAVEDLHWSDPTSAEFFASLVERLPGAALLFLGTYRPGYRPAWLEKSYATQLPVPPLSAPDSVQLLRAVLQTETIPVPLTQVLLTKAQGNPFFLEELAQALMEQGGMGDETHDHSPVPTPALRALQLPPTVHGVLAARIDSLAHEAKYLLQCAAVIGIEVPVPLLQAITEWPEARLQQGLAHLQAIEFLYETRVMPACHYTFKHALTQEVAYQSVLRSTRQQYHQRIAQVLEQQCPEMSETQPELLAHHYTEAGLRAQAIPYWQRAGQRAFQGSANLEAVAHLTKGLEVLATLPDTPERAQQELTLSITLGLALRVTRGFAAPEVAATYHRARELCRQVGETPQLFPVLGGLVLFYNNRGEFQTARELAEQMLNLAQRVHDPARLVNAHITLGNALFFLDELVTACTHLEQGIARYLEQGIARYQPLQDRSHGLSNLTHVGVHGLSRLAQILWMLGYPDQALQRSQEALTLAQELSYPFSLATALLFAATLHRHRREGHRAYEQSEAALVLSGEQGFSLRLAQATILQGWALVEQGQGQAGMAQIRQGLAGRQASGVATAGYLDLLAEACWKTGQIEEGLWAIAEALAPRDSRGSRGGAELYRLKGELLLRTGHDATEAEERFQHALATARSQQAKSWELRAAMSLSRLWQQQGKCQEAYDLLAPVYGWFTEGFDTADLQDAQALLAELVG
jgi:predicted ATPase